MVSHVDDLTGKIIKTLEKTGLADNTIVILHLRSWRNAGASPLMAQNVFL